MAKPKPRSCKEVRSIIRQIEAAWRQWATEVLILPRCWIKRRGRNVWLALSHRLTDGCRMKRARKVTDDGRALTYGDASAWLTTCCQAMTDRALEDIRVAQKARRQLEITIEGRTL